MRRLLALALPILLLVSPCAFGQTDDTQTSRPSFAEFLAGIRTEALARGIRADIVDAALAGIEEPSATVIERDRTQAEVVQSLEQYLDQRLTAKTIATGRERLAEYHDLLEEIGATYGVPPSLIVAVWGFESNFGRFSGVRPTVAALATLAWDQRRSALFRRELFAALDILNRGDIDLASLRGSWAGAMGQVQFMPSSYLRYAEDYDGDGRRDIWSTPADIFASIANYLHSKGWTNGQPWGREVAMDADVRRRVADEIDRRAGGCQATRDMTAVLPASRWRALGVRTTGGGTLPDDTPDAAIVTGASRSFLVYGNYDALLEYNCAHSYAVGVALLADAVASPDAALPVAKASATKHTRAKKRRRATSKS